METSNVFTYQWNCTDNNINVFGITADGQSVYIKVTDFTPYVYLELPENIDWNAHVNTFSERLVSGLRDKPVKKSLVYKRKLYYAHKNDKGENKMFPFLFMSFKNKASINQLRFMKPVTIPGICKDLVCKIHEQDATPVLQMTCIQDISPVGWVSVKGVTVPDFEKESLCDIEIVATWRNVTASTCTDVVDPLIMSFDIECNSSNPNAMPNCNKPADKIFQISISLTTSKSQEKYLLSLGNPDKDIVGCEVRTYATEHALLCAYSAFIRINRPQVIVGYNIFGFDIPYMIGRAKHCMCLSSFDQQGYIAGSHAVEKTINWSSSAFKDQHFEFLDVEGVLFVDLLPLVKRDYKFDNFKLKTVSENLLKDATKDPLTPQDIFKCYETFTPKSLGVVGKYCVQDSVLVSRLCGAMQVWLGLCEMAKTCHVPIFTLYTQGQQIKVFSQVYKYCMSANIVVEKNGYVGNDTYTGAYVVDPVPGVYDMVVPFDFASLYPTTIIAYNIDYSTLVLDEKMPDSMCHVIEWEDHVGCTHDNNKKVEKIVCAKHRFRFLKDGLGVIPTIIQNLLQARKVVNGQIKQLKETGGSKLLIDVLDKRQLSYKVSANSMYGALGVQRGYLPFMPAAMCTTAMGRKSIIKAAEFIQTNYGGKLVYGDTDSTMIVFPETDTEKLWKLCEKIEQDMLCIFPKPMRLAFEEKIYKRFFILTKKRYMALECGRSGEFMGKITKKGVLLARRDNSRAVRNIYEKTIMNVLHYSVPDIESIVDASLAMFQRKYVHSDFIITKSVNDISSYKQRDLPDDEKKKAKRLKDLKCTEDAYIEKCLPAHIQLAEKMRRRGIRVDVGSRLEYVITQDGDRLSEKVEDIVYFNRHAAILRMDYLYYIKLLINPIDQILGITTPHGDLMAKMYKTHQLKAKLCSELLNISQPIIV